MIAVASAAFSRPLASPPARRPAGPFGSRLFPSQGVTKRWQRRASPSGDCPGGGGGGSSSSSSDGGGSDPPLPPTGGGGDRGGGSGDSWGTSVVGLTANRPTAVLTCVSTVAAGAFALLWAGIKQVDKKVNKKLNKLRKSMRKQRSQTQLILKQTEQILNVLGGAAQSGVRGDSGASAAAS